MAVSQELASRRAPIGDWAAIAGWITLPLMLILPLVGLPEADALYHLRHASVYVEKGPLFHEFPWHTQSVIGDLGADIWYGFHLLLTPFSLIGDPMLSIKLASSALLSLLLIALYALFRCAAAPLAWLWPFVLLGATPIESWRWLAMRPFLVSLSLAAWLLWIACRGSAKPWGMIALAFGVAWVHAAFGWLVPLVAIAALASRGLTEGVWRTGVLGWTSLGCALGLFARPDALDAMRILKVQLVDLGAALRSDPFLNFGSEVYSIVRFGAVGEFGLFAAFWLAVVGAALGVARLRGASLSRDRKAAFVASFALAALFALMAFFQTLRATEPWVVFATFSMALAMGAALASAPPGDKDRKASCSTALAWGVAVLALLGSARSLLASRQAIDAAGHNMFRLERAMSWLQANSEKGDIVFHTGWALFPEMFFWNTHNRYITGMDPIFLYAHDRALFYKFTGIEVDVTTARVTGSRPGLRVEFEDTFDVLEQQFRARFVLAVHETNPEFVRYLRTDGRYREAYSDEAVSVFELRRTSRPRGRPD